MAKSISDSGKKRGRGRPKTGIGKAIGLRLYPDIEKALAQWIWKQSDSPSRPEAIRRLVELGLGVGSHSDPGIAMVPLAAHPKPGQRGRASEMASQQIDKIGDPSATDKERRQRKSRLIKEPHEFREMRGDLPKPRR